VLGYDRQVVDRQAPIWVPRLRRDRTARGWSVDEAVEVMRLHAGPLSLPGHDTLVRNWKRWEQGAVKLPEGIYRDAIAAMFASVPDAYFPPQRGRLVLTDDHTVELVERIRSSQVDQAGLDALRATVDRLCSAYASEPAPIVLADAETWLQGIDTLMNQRLGLAQHRELLDLTGWLSLLVACLRYDSGDEPGAHTARRSALALAEETGDEKIAAWVYEIQSWVAITNRDWFGAVRAAQEGLGRTDHDDVSVQLRAQAARGWAHLGDRDRAIVEQEHGRELMARLPFPDNPRNHFVIDPTKYDFYSMDIWRLTHADDLAAAAAETVIQTSITPDGKPTSPMRLAEAYLTLAVIEARRRESDRALDLTTDALALNRRCVPSLLLAAGEVAEALRAAGDDRWRDLAGRLRQLRAASS